MNKLNVFFEEKLVGIFLQDDEMLYSFKYSTEWLRNKKAFPISISMPLRESEFGNKLTLSYFENLLPEGNVRARLERWHHAEGAFNTLAKYGEDCAGALVIKGEDSPSKKRSREQYAEIILSDIYSAITKSNSAVSLLANKKRGYFVIAGAQDKFPCIYENSHVLLPMNGEPTTHIIKTPIIMKGIKESVYNEYFCMRLASKIGFNVPKVYVIEGKHPLFVVERYDRKNINGNVHRIHQLDFCQAQGLTSRNKYEVYGGPSLLLNYNLMIGSLEEKKKEECSTRLIDWICFNLLIGNNDSHSKNISLLLIEGKYDLAPFYDLISTAVYSNIDKNFAFKIGGETMLYKMGKRAIALEEKNLGLQDGIIVKRMNLIYQNILNVQDDLIQEMSNEFAKSKIQKRVKELIYKRAKNFCRVGLNLS